MGLSVNGENNRLTIVVEGRERELTEEVPGLDIAVEGNDNRVRIEYPQTFENSRLKITGPGNCFEAAASYRRTDGVFFCLGDGCRISIGRNCFFNRDIAVLAKEKKAVSVVFGDDVIVGTGTIIRCGDGHTVVDAGSRDPLNPPADIAIGSHVWIGARCMILKGAVIGRNSIVGAMSLVNKKFAQPNQILAGVPAAVIRCGVDWDMADYASYTEI